MMDQKQAARDAQAIDWVIRQRDPAFADWDAFTAWLEADPDHAGAFHAAAMVDADMGDLPRQPVAPPRHVPRPVRSWGGAGAAAAAALLVGLVGYGAIDQTPALTWIVTKAGERRTLTLADGSSIVINGGTRIAVDRERPRFAQLDAGEAMFHVVHRPTDPFEVAVGGAMLRDVGTAFDVVRSGGSTTVAVSEGAVVYNPAAENVRVDAGRQLRAGDGDSVVRVSAVVPESVGSWRIGQLVYDGAPLATVVADLQRGTTLRIVLADGLETRPFRGVLRTGQAEAPMIADLAALAGLRAERRADGWHLVRGGT
jgi:transmembrane sensor